MRSLLNRLSLSLSLALLGGALVLGLALQDFPRQLVEGYVRSRLEHDVDRLYARLRTMPDGSLDGVAGAIYELPLSGHYYRIDRGEQVLRSRSLWDEDLEMPALPAGAAQVDRQPGPAGQLLLRYAKAYAGAEPLRIAVAEDIGALETEIRRFGQRALIVFIVVLGLSLALLRRMLSRGLAPLGDAVDACRRLERGETLPIDRPAPSEVQPMVDAVNRLVRLHGQRLARIRHAVGNLSHALKTPLTVLGQQAERLDAQGQPEAAQAIREQIEQMRASLERELRRARLAGGGPPGAGFNPAEHLAALIGALTRLHPDKPLEIRPTRPLPADALALDREDLMELFGNLLDNACKWARARIELTVWIEQGALHYRIEDDGPGVSEDWLPRLGQAGVRRDETRPGHGLGLAIVGDILAQYGGTQSYGRSGTLGGLRVEGSIPLEAAG